MQCDEKLKRGKNEGNLTLCRSANLELVANLLGSQSIWGNQMGGPEIRILERDRPNLDQISWRKICKIHPQKLFCVKKSYKQKTSVPWFDQWVSSSTEAEADPISGWSDNWKVTKKIWINQPREWILTSRGVRLIRSTGSITERLSLDSANQPMHT